MKNDHEDQYAYVKDTIAARATAAGRAGIGIVRVSGNLCQTIARGVLGLIPQPRYATFSKFLYGDGSTIDEGLALFFEAPNSFTGEDVLELHGHGGTYILDFLLQRVLDLGARLARPGEFSERAFLNGKIDLVQAEAIADVIEAQSLEAARTAVRSLQGVFSEKITCLVDATIRLRVYVEAAIDFPEEEIDYLSDGKIKSSLEDLISQIKHILAEAKQGAALKEGMKVVVAGPPNAGKSSLLNALSGVDSAIVSDIPGTTRDVIKETILIDGMPIHILDTAGLRETNDLIELEGVARALKEIPNADRVLLIIDAAEQLNDLGEHPQVKQFEEHWQRLTIIKNKIDLTGEDAISYKLNEVNIDVIHLSAKSSLGIPLLRTHLKECMGYQGGNTSYSARSRHLRALNRALKHFQQAMDQLIPYSAGELVAEEILGAQNALSEITGSFRADDLLGEIFSSFCLGK